MKQLVVYDLQVVPRPLTRPADEHRGQSDGTDEFTAHKSEPSHCNEKQESASRKEACAKR